MIYLDNGATTYPKPKSVVKKIEWAMNNCGNPGRGGHIFGQNSEKIIYDCRAELAELFNVEKEENIIFTLNATQALNIAIKSEMQDGTHAVVGGFEHNSAVRPLETLGVDYTIAYSELFNPDDAYEKITSSVREDTKCIVLNHVSNVFGNELPIYRINDFCRENKIALILDISQSAGSEKIDAKKLDAVNYLCKIGRAHV